MTSRYGGTVIRARARLIVLAALAGAVATGCSTFTDNQLAAKVGDAELSHDDLDQLLADGGITEVDTDRYSGNQVREEISDWVRRRLAEDAHLFDTYAIGEGSLPIACNFVLQVADRSAADAAVQRMNGGEEWNAVAADVAPTAPDFGRQQCGVISGYRPDIGERLAALPANGEPVVLEIEEPAGVFVVRAQTVEELALEDFALVVQQTEPDVLVEWVQLMQSADVYVDPRFGVYDGERVSVMPIG